jgi:hypothetical protein
MAFIDSSELRIAAIVRQIFEGLICYERIGKLAKEFRSNDRGDRFGSPDIPECTSRHLDRLEIAVSKVRKAFWA